MAQAEFDTLKNAGRWLSNHSLYQANSDALAHSKTQRSHAPKQSDLSSQQTPKNLSSARRFTRQNQNDLDTLNPHPAWFFPGVLATSLTLLMIFLGLQRWFPQKNPALEPVGSKIPLYGIPVESPVESIYKPVSEPAIIGHSIDQPIRGNINLAIEPVIQPVPQPVTQPISEPVIQPVPQPVVQPIPQPVSLTVTTATTPVVPPITTSFNPATDPYLNPDIRNVDMPEQASSSDPTVQMWDSGVGVVNPNIMPPTVPPPIHNEDGSLPISLGQVNTSAVSISLRDNRGEDGDYINLIVNGILHLSHQLLLNQPIVITVPLQPGPNYIDIVGIRDGHGGITTEINVDGIATLTNSTIPVGGITRFLIMRQ